jgi:biotin carboxyl carrier protein
MKYRVKVEEQWFDVEISDLTTRPVVAYVDGVPFEVWPESSSSSSVQAVKQPAPAAAPPLPKPASHAPSGINHQSLKAVRAPIPGVIISIAVQPNSQVDVGQELCVLEAMKMRNSIRATRGGEIVRVNVTPGQHVRHHEVLMEFAD